MKKRVVTALVLMLIVTSAMCAQTVTYDVAVRNIVTQIVRAIDENEIIAIVGFDSTSEQFSTRIIDDITRDLINDGIKVVERQRLDAVLREQNFQLSGNVSDKSMQSIGRMLGASSIIVGNGENMVEHYRINFRVLSVRTALVKRQIAQDVTYNANMRRMLSRNTASDAIGKTTFYIGGMLGPGIGLHSIDDDVYEGQTDNPKEESGVGFAFSLYVGYQILEHLAIQSGLDFLFNNNVKLSGGDWSQSISLHTLDIPLLARYTIIFSPIVLDVIGGFHLSFPVGKINIDYSDDYSNKGAFSVTPKNATFGMNFGVNVGYKLGPGNIIGGISFVFDFNPLRAEIYTGATNWLEKKEMDVVTRRSLNIMVGYGYKL